MSTAQVCCRDGSSLDDLRLYEAVSWWIEGVIQIVINVIGIIANCVAIPVLLSRKLANVFNRTLAILAVLDAIFNMCDIFESIRIFHGGECRSLHVYLFPYVLYPLQNITMVASIYTTVIVAIERYYAVTRPISAFVDDGGGKWKKKERMKEGRLWGKRKGRKWALRRKERVRKVVNRGKGKRG